MRNKRLVLLNQELAIYGPWAKYGLLPLWVGKVLMEHSSACLLTVCLRPDGESDGAEYL